MPKGRKGDMRTHSARNKCVQIFADRSADVERVCGLIDTKRKSIDAGHTNLGNVPNGRTYLGLSSEDVEILWKIVHFVRQDCCLNHKAENAQLELDLGAKSWRTQDRLKWERDHPGHRK